MGSFLYCSGKGWNLGFFKAGGQEVRQVLDQSDPGRTFVVNEYCSNDRRTNELLSFTRKNARCQGTLIQSGFLAGLSVP
ncbi:MAG: hypothetical protein CMJ81_05090 [Planctomycetaceae bacterium]|nr:hypothetical protein [Planctomycetaceae bacterium]